MPVPCVVPYSSVVFMPIYTRTGDTGQTSLLGGKRVLKCEELVDVYGSLDELNSWVGLVSAKIEAADVQQFLTLIQADLFTIGSHLAGWKADLAPLEKRVKEMETRIDALDAELAKINNFILPGGTELAALIHVVRGVCRRVERQAVGLALRQKIDPRIITYLNRLSDLFFMLARFINNQAGVEETTWSSVPRQASKHT